MKKVLVTGATGFIGKYVIDALLERELSVIATSSGNTPVENMPWYKSAAYIPFNLHDFDANTNYYSYFGEPDAMIHLAWEGLPNYTSLFHFEDNLPRHYSFLKNMIVHGLKDLTVTGTCFEYGMVEGCLNEAMKADPANPYALAKDTLRRFLSELNKLQPFSFKWARLFYMYGGGQNPKSIFSQLDKAIEEGQEVFNMSAGEQERDYLPVEKIASYITSIATQQGVTGIINCCSGEPVKLKELVQQHIQNKKSNIQLNLGYYPYVTYEPMRFWGDNKRLQSILKNERPG